MNDPIELFSQDFDNHGNIKMDKFMKIPFRNKMIVGFFMEQCGHCLAMQPEYNKFSNDIMSNSRGIVCKVETKHCPDLFSRITQENWPYKIDGFPTVIAYKNGVAHSFFNGKRDSQTLTKYINSI